MNAHTKLQPANDAATVPANIEAEQCLLGILLCDNNALDAVYGIVRPEHFHEPFHGRLYERAADMIRAGRLAEAVLLAEQFRTDPACEELGGLAYLALLAEQSPPAANAADYAKVIADNAGRRAVLALFKDVGARAMDAGSEPLTDVLMRLERGAAEIANESALSESWTPAGLAVREAINHAQTRKGTIDFPYGIASLDRFIGGMNAGEVTLLAARPGMGKSVAALNIARANAAQRLGVCFFSLEMTKAALAMRVACDVTYDRGAPVYAGQPSSPTFNAAMKGELEPHQWRQIDEASDIIDGWPLVIDDRSGLNMAQIEAAARRQHRRWERQGIKPGPVIIDHLGKVRPMTDRKGSKHAEVADVSADAQSMAKRLGVPVLALVQLNRGVEGRDDKRPQLSDLRQAGELEEDARQVIFLFRPEYYVRDGAPDESFEERTKRVEKLDQCRNQLLWLVEKNSHGPRGQVQTFCEIACSAIRDWDR